MFCIMRTEKRKKSDLSGIQKENTRTATEYNNKVSPGMDIFNVTLKESNDWLQDINKEIQAAGAKARSNSVMALDTIYTASPQFFQERTNAENDQFFQDCLKFHNEHFGHIISAVVHYDETTPHLHVISVPLTKDGRLSARDVIGNKAKMTKTQDQFFEQVGRGYGLERGVQMDGQEKKKRITAQEWQLRQTKQEKAKELEELGAIKHSKESARERATRAREQAEQQRAENSRLKAVEGQIRDRMEQEQTTAEQLTELNQKARQELRKTKEQLEALKGYLDKAEQRELQEILEREQDGFELE